jgi:hypothetical protein
MIINRKIYLLTLGALISSSLFAQQNDSLYSVLENVFYKKQQYVNKDDNNIEVLKSVNLNPEVNESFFNQAVSNLQSHVLKAEITELRDNQPLKGVLDKVVFAQCVFNSIEVYFPGISDSFKDKALECYNEKVIDDAASSSLASSAYANLDDKALRNYADIVFSYLKTRYCSLDQNKKEGLQAKLSQCSGAAAKLLFEDLKAKWITFSKTKHAVDIPKSTMVAMDKAFNCAILLGGECSSKVDSDNALEAVKNIYNSFDAVVKISQADLVDSIMNAIKKTESLSGLSYLFNVDKISKNAINPIWGNSNVSTPTKQRVSIYSDNDLKMNNFYSNLAQDVLLEQLYPYIDLPESGYFATNNNSIELIDVSSINNSSIYWPIVNGSPKPALESVADSKLYRENTLAQIKEQQNQYMSQVRRNSLAAKAALDVLAELIALRMPNKHFQDEKGNVASIQEWEKTTAFMRQNATWNESIKRGQIADVLKQIAIISSEIRTQLYLNGRQLQLNNALQAMQLISQSMSADSDLNNLKKNIEDLIENYRNGGQDQSASADPESVAASSIANVD